MLDIAAREAFKLPEFRPRLRGGDRLAPVQQGVSCPWRFAGIGYVEPEVDRQADVHRKRRQKPQRVTNDTPRVSAMDVIDGQRAHHRHRQKHHRGKPGGTRGRPKVESQTRDRPDEAPSGETRPHPQGEEQDRAHDCE